MKLRGTGYKTWKDVKEGDTIYYYDKGKIHEQLVHSVENKEEVTTYQYGWTTTKSVYKYILIKAGHGSNIRIFEHYIDKPYYEDNFFTRFTSKEAAIDCLKQHLSRLQDKVKVAREKYERYLNISKKYDKVIKDYNEIIGKLN